MKILRYVLLATLGFPVGCGLTLDLDDPDLDSAVDGGVGDGSVMDRGAADVFEEDSGAPDGSVDAMPDPDMRVTCVNDGECVALGLCAECVAGFCEPGGSFIIPSPLANDGVSLEYCDDERGRGTVVIDGPTGEVCSPGELGCLEVAAAAPEAVDVCDGLDNNDNGAHDEDCTQQDADDCTHYVYGHHANTETVNWADLEAADPPLQDGSVVCFVATSTPAHCRDAPGWTMADAMPTGINITLLGGLRHIRFQDRRIVHACTGNRADWPVVEMFETTEVTSHVRIESLHVRGPFGVVAGGHLELSSASLVGTGAPAEYMIRVQGAFTAYDSHIEDRGTGRNLIKADNAALTIVASELVRGNDGFAIHATNSFVTLQNNCTLGEDGACEPEILAIGGHVNKPGIYGQGGASALYMDGGQLSAIHNVFVSLRVRTAEEPTVYLNAPSSVSLQSNWIGNYGGSVGLRVDECSTTDACVSENNTILMVPARAGGLIAAPQIRGASISGTWSFQDDEIGALGVNPEVTEIIGVSCEADDGGACVFREGAYIGAIDADDIPPFWELVLRGLGWTFMPHRPALSIGIQCDGCISLSNLDAHGGTATSADGVDTVGVGIRIVNTPAEGTILSGVRATAGEAVTRGIGLETQDGLTIVVNSSLFGGEALMSNGLVGNSPVWLRNTTAVGGTNEPTQQCIGATLSADSVVLSSLLVAFCNEGSGLTATGIPRIVLDTGFVSLPTGVPHVALTDAMPLINFETFVTLDDLGEFRGTEEGLRPCLGTTAVGRTDFNTQTDQQGDPRLTPPALGALRREGPCLMAEM